jgi:glyoxylase-like metal-dependent hydrolase (beta-lactamase superfamily II)
MQQILDDIYSIPRSLREDQSRGAVYVLVNKGWLTLVDTGAADDAPRIQAELRDAGLAIDQVRQIVLTHCHGDHTGSASKWSGRLRASVMAHQADEPYIKELRMLPFRQRVQRWMYAYLQPRLTRPCKVDAMLLDGQDIAALRGLRVIHTPGHTPGSICLYEEERRILFSGDLLITRGFPPWRQVARPPYPWVSVNMTEVWQSVRKVAALEVDVMCAGHGRPILKNAGGMIRRLIS